MAIESYEGGASCGIAEVEDMESRAGSGGGCLPRTGCVLESMVVLCWALSVWSEIDELWPILTYESRVRLELHDGVPVFELIWHLPVESTQPPPGSTYAMCSRPLSFSTRLETRAV